MVCYNRDMTNTTRTRRMSRRDAVATVHYLAAEARYWAGTWRATARDAEYIATEAAGERSPEFRALVKEIRSR